jgi:hypothetical protein
MTHASATLSFARGARGHLKTSSVPEAFTGVKLPDLERIAGVLEARGVECAITEMSHAGEAAYLLHAKHAFDPAAAEAELQTIQFPTQDLSRGSVVNLKKRLNAQVADYSQEADLVARTQKVVHWDTLPACRAIRDYLKELSQEAVLNCDVVVYPTAEEAKDGDLRPVQRCGIGWHGDRERALIAGVRLGRKTKAFPLKFCFFHDWAPVSQVWTFEFEPGDLYIPCAKATGFDAGRPSVVSLKHAAGGAEVERDLESKKRKRAAKRSG